LRYVRGPIAIFFICPSRKMRIGSPARTVGGSVGPHVWWQLGFIMYPAREMKMVPSMGLHHGAGYEATSCASYETISSFAARGI